MMPRASPHRRGLAPSPALGGLDLLGGGGADDDQGDRQGQGGEDDRELEGGRDAVGQDLVGQGGREPAGRAELGQGGGAPWLAASWRLAVPKAVTRMDSPRAPPTCWATFSRLEAAPASLGATPE